MDTASLGNGSIHRGPVGKTFATICESEFPIAKIPDRGSFALAIITGIEGASYRPMGAMMVIDQAGRHWGHLSSGCLEQDLILRAQSAMARGKPVSLRYGLGSEFIDIQLPCGGGLDITILPDPDRGLLAEAAARLSRRESVQVLLGDLGVEPTSGSFDLGLMILPRLRFVVLGRGPEAACFARLADQSGYPAQLYSTDPDTLSAAGFGCLSGTSWPEGVSLDARSAVTLFYHDHDREPDLLEHAFRSPAFYIGAQGSLRAHRNRCDELTRRGISQDQIDRIASPFGLIPSARDPRTLAVSVLADILARAQRQMTA
jgi:xanthine dehydrogenase accessory factor